MKKIIIIFFIAISLISCSNDEDSISPIKGKWKLVENLNFDNSEFPIWETVSTEYQYTFKINNSGNIESSIHSCKGSSEKFNYEPLFTGDNIVKINFDCKNNTDNPYAFDSSIFWYNLEGNDLTLSFVSDVANEGLHLKFERIE